MDATARCRCGGGGVDTLWVIFVGGPHFRGARQQLENFKLFRIFSEIYRACWQSEVAPTSTHQHNRLIRLEKLPSVSDRIGSNLRDATARCQSQIALDFPNFLCILIDKIAKRLPKNLGSLFRSASLKLSAKWSLTRSMTRFGWNTQGQNAELNPQYRN